MSKLVQKGQTIKTIQNVNIYPIQFQPYNKLADQRTPWTPIINMESQHLFPVRIIDYIQFKVWDEITYAFPFYWLYWL